MIASAGKAVVDFADIPLLTAGNFNKAGGGGLTERVKGRLYVILSGR